MIKTIKLPNKKATTYSLIFLLVAALLVFVFPKEKIIATIKPEDTKLVGTDKIVLTLNKSIQNYSQSALKNAMKTYKAKNGTIIVMETSTGKILALASQMGSKPTDTTKLFNTKYGDNSLFSSNNNFAVTNLQTAGSLFKAITTAAVLKYNPTEKNENYICDKYAYNSKAKTKINCWNLAGHGKLNFEDGFINSCNAVFCQAGSKVNNSKFSSLIKDFGFTKVTGIELKNEELSELPNLNSEIEKAIACIGTNIKATPIQLINSINAIANSGRLMRPYIIEKATNASGSLIYNKKPLVIKNVINKTTAATIVSLMTNYVSHVPALNAALKNLDVAGISATALKEVNKSYKKGIYVSSFCGFAPAKNPKITVLVVIDEPSSDNPYSSATAAPVFKKILQNSINYIK